VDALDRRTDGQKGHRNTMRHTVTKTLQKTNFRISVKTQVVQGVYKCNLRNLQKTVDFCIERGCRVLRDIYMILFTRGHLLFTGIADIYRAGLLYHRDRSDPVYTKCFSLYYYNDLDTEDFFLRPVNSDDDDDDNKMLSYRRETALHGA